MKKMIYIVTFLNILFTCLIVGESPANLVVIIGIVVLLYSILLSIKNIPKESTFTTLEIFNYKVEFSSLLILFFGVFGIYSMLEITDTIDMKWFYFLFLNIYILSNFRLRIKKSKNSPRSPMSTEQDRIVDG